MSIIINDIIWLDTVVEKLAWKHRVLPHEVEEVLSGKCRIFKRGSGDIEGEDLYNALGQTKGGISRFFLLKSSTTNVVLIITARDVNRRERRGYEKK